MNRKKIYSKFFIAGAFKGFDSAFARFTFLKNGEVNRQMVNYTDHKNILTVNGAIFVVLV